MSELNRTTKLLIETDEEDPDAAPQKSAKEIEEEKKAEKDAQQKMVNTNTNKCTQTNTTKGTKEIDIFIICNNLTRSKKHRVLKFLISTNRIEYILSF